MTKVHMKHEITSIAILRNCVQDFQLSGDLARDVPRFFARFGFEETAEHCTAVAAKAKELALRFGCAPDDAEQAGYLHDISAVIPNPNRIDFARSQNVDILAEEETFPMIIHQKLSVEIARELFDVHSPAILSAIGCHTTLKADASILDRVVFLADKIAWDQPGTPPYRDQIAAAMQMQPNSTDSLLDTGVLGTRVLGTRALNIAVLAYLDYLWAQRATLRVVHPWAVAARDDLLQKL